MSQVDELNDRLAGLSLEEGLRLVAALFPGEVVFSSAFGQEDQVITDAIFKNDIDIEVFTLDTVSYVVEATEVASGCTSDV